MIQFGLPQRLIAAGAVCIAALIGLVLMEGAARAAGTEVIVAMRPVDPRALLTGHYVQLSFDDAIPLGGACPPTDIESGADGWIALRKAGDRHVVAAVMGARAAAAPLGDVVVRGAATCNPPSPPSTEVKTGQPGNVTMRLAVERFHADQDEAVALETAMRDVPDGETRLFAILSIGKDGAPRTKGLIVDGKRVDLTWF